MDEQWEPSRDDRDGDEDVATPHLDVLSEGEVNDDLVRDLARAEVPETERGKYVPKRMAWPQSWHTLIATVRALTFPVFW